MRQAVINMIYWRKYQTMLPTTSPDPHIRLWHHAKRFAYRLIQPAPMYDTLPHLQRNQVQALNATLWLGGVALVIATVTFWLFIRDYHRMRGTLLLLFGDSVLFIGSYVLVQRGMWRTAVYLVYPAQLLMMFALALSLDAEGMSILYYLTFIMVWSGYFMMWRSWLLMIALTVALVSLYVWLTPSITLLMWYRQVGLFTLVASVIVILVRLYQERIHVRYIVGLTNAEAHLRAIIESSSDGYYLLKAVKDVDGSVVDFEITEVNTPACRQLNMTRQQLVGSRICELFPVNRSGGFFEQYKTVYLTGVPLEQEYYIPENMIGTGWYHHQVIPVVDGVVIINRDITQRKQRELELVKRQNRLQSLLEAQTSYLIRTDLQGRYTFANQRFLDQFNYDEGDIIGTDAMLSIYVEDHDKARDAVQRCLENPNVPVSVTLRKLTKSGELLWTDWEFTALSGSSGEVMEIQCVGMDATARMLAQEAQLEAERLRIELRQQAELTETKMRMMGRISHEFRTPLAVIRSSADLLKLYNDKMTPEKRAEKIDNINAAIVRLTEMLDDMGLILQGQAKPHVIKQACDVPNLLKDIVMRYQAVEDYQRDYIVKIQADFPMVMADKDHIELLITNLISNATKFSPITKPITVELTYTDIEWVLMVRDEGIGILPDEQDKIFEPFFRGTNFGEISGMGLGLSVVKRIVDAHNGLILVASTPHVGTTVTVRMPRA